MTSPSGHVLVFDSGVGGLSIVRHIRSALPGVRLSYLADTAFFPYGMLTEAQLVERVLALLDRAGNELQPDLIVLACNSASTIALPHLRQHLTIPIVGVVPAIKPAAQLSESKVIGLLATPGTVNRRYTDELIEQFAPQCQVLRLGTSELVELVERQLWGSSQSAEAFRSILAPLQEDARWQQLDTMVLACTHFPLVKDLLAQAAPTVKHWVDSGEAIARRVQHVLHTTESSRPNAVPAGEPETDRGLLTGVQHPSTELARAFSDYGFASVTQF